MNRVENFGKAVAVITGVIGVPTAIFTLVFLLAPNVTPWTTLRVDISEPSIEHNANKEAFSQRAYLDPKRPQEDADLALVQEPSTIETEDIGNVVSYRLEAEGFARRTLRVYWSVYEESGQRVSNDALNDQFAWPTNNFEANRRINVISGDAFVPLPTTDCTYFVKIGVWDGQGARMDLVNSPKFEVSGGRSKEVPPGSETNTE